MIRLLQEELPKLWTDEFYSEQFKASPSQYKDFEHGILHVMKTLGKLVSFVEEADHAGSNLHSGKAYFPKAEIEKYLADVVICTIRLALRNPTGIVDLEKAILSRIEEKMGAKLCTTGITTEGDLIFSRVDGWVLLDDLGREAQRVEDLFAGFGKKRVKISIQELPSEKD